MTKIKEIKKLLLQSLEMLPLDITSRYTRSHIESAIKELSDMEKIQIGKKINNNNKIKNI